MEYASTDRAERAGMSHVSKMRQYRDWPMMTQQIYNLVEAQGLTEGENAQ